MNNLYNGIRIDDTIIMNDGKMYKGISTDVHECSPSCVVVKLNSLNKDELISSIKISDENI